MPIKKDVTGKRWVEMEIITPGTPEQVWQAVATGNGNSAWFTKATIDERVGGAVVFDMGAHGVSRGEVRKIVASVAMYLYGDDADAQAAAAAPKWNAWLSEALAPVSR